MSREHYEVTRNSLLGSLVVDEIRFEYYEFVLDGSNGMTENEIEFVDISWLDKFATVFLTENTTLQQNAALIK